MVVVDVDGSSLPSDSCPKSFGLVWGLASTWHSVCIWWKTQVNSHNGFAMMRAPWTLCRHWDIIVPSSTLLHHCCNFCDTCKFDDCLRGWDKLFAVISNNKLAFYKDQKHYKTVCITKSFCMLFWITVGFWNRETVQKFSMKFIFYPFLLFIFS